MRVISCDSGEERLNLEEETRIRVPLTEELERDELRLLLAPAVAKLARGVIKTVKTEVVSSEEVVLADEGDTGTVTSTVVEVARSEQEGVQP